MITDRVLAKRISADILAEEPVGVFSDFGFSGWKKIPEGLFRDRLCKRNIWITVSDREKDGIPSDRVLRLVPRCVALGIGCKRGTPAEKIRETVEDAMRRNGIDLRSVFAVASIDIKKQEQGIIDFANTLQVPFLTFSSEELNSQPERLQSRNLSKRRREPEMSARDLRWQPAGWESETAGSY